MQWFLLSQSISSEDELEGKSMQQVRQTKQEKTEVTISIKWFQYRYYSELQQFYKWYDLCRHFQFTKRVRWAAPSHLALSKPQMAVGAQCQNLKAQSPSGRRRTAEENKVWRKEKGRSRQMWGIQSSYTLFQINQMAADKLYLQACTKALAGVCFGLCTFAFVSNVSIHGFCLYAVFRALWTLLFLFPYKK